MGKQRFACWVVIFSLISPSVASYPQVTEPDTIATATAYFEALASADKVEFQREFEFPWLVLLNDDEKQSYLELDSLSDRKSFIGSYWRRMNPNPLAGENEFLSMFLVRWSYVKKHFSSDSPPYFDDRGKYYLKFGEPTHRYRDSGGSKTMRFFKDREVYQYISRLYSGFPPNIHYRVLPNETWVYRNIAENYIVHFVNDGAEFHEAKSLSRALETRISKNLAWYWSDMVQYRAQLSRSLSRAANNLLQIENDILTSAIIGAKGPLRTDSRLPDRQILEQKTILETEVIQSRREAPLFIFYSPGLTSDLNFFSDVAQFRGADDSTRVEILWLIPIKNNILPEKATSIPDSITIGFQSLWRDSAFTPAVRIEETIKYPGQFLQARKHGNIIDHYAFSARPQTGDLTLGVTVENFHKQGYAKQPITVRDFSGDELMISDIQFFTTANGIDNADFFPILTRQNIAVVPYPFQNIRKSTPVFCYFEIYNLQSKGIDAGYEITIKVLSDKSRDKALKKLSNWIMGKKHASVSTIYTRSAVKNVVHELISVDFSNLDNGYYILEIRVRNEQDKAIRCQRQKRVSIVDGR